MELQLGQKSRRSTKAQTESQESEAQRMCFRIKRGCHRQTTQADCRGKHQETRYKTSERKALSISLDKVALMTDPEKESQLQKAD